MPTEAEVALAGGVEVGGGMSSEKSDETVELLDNITWSQEEGEAEESGK